MAGKRPKLLTVYKRVPAAKVQIIIEAESTKAIALPNSETVWIVNTLSDSFYKVSCLNSSGVR